MTLRSSPRRWPSVLGWLLLAIYLSWNAWWLSVARVPPSLLSGLTGIPCPTTGGTRSAQALLAGDLQRSLYFNPMTIPIVLLMVVTLGQLAARRRVANWLGIAWIGTLAIAWILKLCSSAATW